MTVTPHVNIAHARTELQHTTMERSIRNNECPFCRDNLERYHTRPILAENEHWLLTENFAPYEGAVHHYLLIAIRHCMGFWELSEVEQVAFFTMMNQARELAMAPGGTIVMRWGDTDRTGASVAHLHAQLIIGGSRKAGGEPILTALGYKVPTSSTKQPG